MKKTFLVIGLGRFGLSVVKTLSDLNCEVLAIDIIEDQVNLAANYVSHCAICDATKKQNLKELGVSDVDHAIVSIGGNFQASILTTINLKELGVPKITVRVDEESHIAVMTRLGADKVIIPEEESATSLANEMVFDNLLDYYKVSKDFGVVQFKVGKNFKETTLIDMDSRNRFDINIVGIIRDDKFFIPKGTDLIKSDDIVLVIGQNNKLNKFSDHISQ